MPFALRVLQLSPTSHLRLKISKAMTYLVDTHCHLNHEKFINVPEVIDKAKSEGVDYIIVPGWDIPSSERAIELAGKYEGVFAAVGFHPHEASKVEAGSLNKIEALSKLEKVVAIGEIGLDYHYDFAPPHIQRQVFEAQIEIAKSVKLPVSIHNRESDSDLMTILERQSSESWYLPKRFDYQINPQPRGVLHSFNSSYKVARQAIDLGFYLGISGMITFGKKSAETELQKIVRMIQPEHLLVETDAPYLAPTPNRGKINEPAFVPLIAAQIAELQNLNDEDVRRTTSYNAYKLFDIGEKPVPKIAYGIKDSLYLNLTLRCDSDCLFCDRKGEAMVKGHNLHIENEPSADDLLTEIGDPKRFKEIVFCGYGEPTTRLDVVLEVARRVKEKGGRTRLDTDGHGSIINHRNILPELRGLIDAVSISLNSIDPGEYKRLMGGANGNGWVAMIEFSKEAVKYIPEVYMSVVGMNGVDVAATKQFVEDEVGAKFRYRPMF